MAIIKSMDKITLNYINAVNEYSFKNGGIAIPKFNTIEEYHKFMEILDKNFPVTSRQFKDLKEGDFEEIKFHIPEKYNKD
jgi:hypothetical protein